MILSSEKKRCYLCSTSSSYVKDGSINSEMGLRQEKEKRLEDEQSRSNQRGDGDV